MSLSGWLAIELILFSYLFRETANLTLTQVYKGTKNWDKKGTYSGTKYEGGLKNNLTLFCIHVKWLYCLLFLFIVFSSENNLSNYTKNMGILHTIIWPVMIIINILFNITACWWLFDSIMGKQKMLKEVKIWVVNWEEPVFFVFLKKILLCLYITVFLISDSCSWASGGPQRQWWRSFPWREQGSRDHTLKPDTKNRKEFTNKYNSSDSIYNFLWYMERLNSYIELSVSNLIFSLSYRMCKIRMLMLVRKDINGVIKSFISCYSTEWNSWTWTMKVQTCHSLQSGSWAIPNRERLLKSCQNYKRKSF